MLKNKIIAICVLVLGSILGGLGNSMESVSPLVWLQYFLILSGSLRLVYDDSDNASTTSLVIAFIVISVICGWSTCLGFSTAFGFPSSTYSTILESYAFGVMVWSLITAIGILPFLVFVINTPSFSLISFVLPTTLTFVYHTIVGRSLSTFANPSNAILDYSPLKGIASLFGSASIEFVLFYIVSTIFLLQLSRREVKTFAYYGATVVFMLFAISGFLNVSDSFYQRDVSTQIIPHAHMSCLFGRVALNGSDEWNSIWINTNDRLANGDLVVLW